MFKPRHEHTIDKQVECRITSHSKRICNNPFFLTLYMEYHFEEKWQMKLLQREWEQGLVIFSYD